LQTIEIHRRSAEYLSGPVPLPLLDLRDTHDLIKPVLNAIHLETSCVRWLERPAGILAARFPICLLAH
jgi:hypothetical protein